MATAAAAQLIPDDPDWREAEAPPPPALRTTGLIPIDLGRGSELRWGADPASISIGPDRIVRYVVVAQGEGGAVTALYEGLRCNSAEVRVYARHARDGGWVRDKGGEWRPLQNNAAARHSLAIARGGACLGRAANATAADVARDLASDGLQRYRPEAR